MTIKYGLSLLSVIGKGSLSMYVHIYYLSVAFIHETSLWVLKATGLCKDLKPDKSFFFVFNFTKLLLYYFKPVPHNIMLAYLLTPWSRVLLEKLTSKFLQLVKKFPAFMEPESPLPYPQVPATCPYPEPTLSSPHDPFQLPEDPSYYYPPIYVLVSPMASIPQASPPTPCAQLYPTPYTPHALPISFVSILPPAQYWVRSTDHSAP